MSVGAPRPVRRTEQPTPETIGEYRILGKLGEGGMAVVFEAEQQHPRRKVALKLIRGDIFLDDSQIKLFQREAEVLGRLKHPSIAAIYETGRTPGGRPYFAMELVRGRTLHDYLQDRPQPDSRTELEHRLEMFREICEGVSYAHQRGVIHRDLKPSNIIVTDVRPPDSARSGNVPEEMSVPAGPIPRVREAMKPVVTTPRPAKARPPPSIAFRQVKCLINPTGVVTWSPVVYAAAR